MNAPVNPALFDLQGHTYQWAMEQLAAGRRVRRKIWPMEWIEKGHVYREGYETPYVVPKSHLVRIHVFPHITRWGGADHMQPIFGWGGVVGADDAGMVCGHYVSGVFTPTTHDAVALDWELSHPAEDGLK